MAASTLTEKDTKAAREIWARYQAEHDLTGDRGQTAGIDPKSGRVWLGSSIPDVISRRNAEGIDHPLRFERVGAKTYYRKGAQR